MCCGPNQDSPFGFLKEAQGSCHDGQASAILPFSQTQNWTSYGKSEFTTCQVGRRTCISGLQLRINGIGGGVRNSSPGHRTFDPRAGYGVVNFHFFRQSDQMPLLHEFTWRASMNALAPKGKPQQTWRGPKLGLLCRNDARVLHLETIIDVVVITVYP